MPTFLCRVADGKGKIEEFHRESASEDALVRELAAKGFFAVSVKEVAEGDAAHGGRGASGGLGRGGRAAKFPRRIVSELTDLLTLMFGSGLSLKDSLEVAESVFSKGKGKDLVSLLLERIRKGGSFASALEDAKESFPPVYRGMTRIGERIGSLDQVFSRLSTYLKDEKKLRDRFISALTYPLIVLGVALISGLMIAIFLLPRLRDMFSVIGPDMAARFDALMTTLGVVFIVIGIAAAGGIVFIISAARMRKKGGPAAVRIDSLILKIPLVSPLLMDRELLNFTFAMETLSSAGVSVEQALTESSQAASNAALREGILAIRERVVKGEKLSAAFASSPLFPLRVSRWIGIGERVGHVEKVFSQLRAFYQQEVEKWLTRLMALMEPALIVGLGIVIILFVVLFIVPIFSMYGNIM